MDYKKLIIFLVILVILYICFQTLKEMTPTEGLKGVKAVPSAGYMFSQDKYVFPENLNGFSMDEKYMKLSSGTGRAKVWCAPPVGNFIPKYFYKIKYIKNNKTLIVKVFIPDNESEAEKCYKANSDFFSKYKNITYKTIFFNTSKGFLIEGDISSVYTRTVFLLNDKYYLIFEDSNNSIPITSFLSKEEILNFASKFKVKEI